MKKAICHIISIMMIFAMIPFSAVTAEAASGDTYTVNISGIYDYSGPQEMMEYINAERQLQGVGKLTLDADLTDAAMQRAAEIAYYFSHTRPDNTKCYTVNSRTSGENIAAGNGTAKGTYTQWYNSQGHYENMVRSSFTNIGIGHFAHNGIHYWVQMFSRDKTKTKETRTGSVPVTTQIRIVEKSGSPLEINGGWTERTIEPGDTWQLEVGAVNSEWQYAYCVFDADSFSWTSSNKEAATVTADGFVTAAGLGETTISAKIGKAAASVKIIVKKDMMNAVVTGIENVEYTGSEITFPVEVTYDGQTLRKNIDYTVEYEDNVAVGSGKVIITGMGDYSGKKTSYFSIKRKDLSKEAEAYLDKWDSSSYESGKACAEANLRVYHNGKQLKLNEDYYVSETYEDSSTGKLTEVYVRFQGNYYGTLSMRCLDTAYAYIEDQGYTGSGIEPEFTLYWNRISYGYTNRSFKKDVDYTVEFVNNKEVGTATVKILPTSRTFGYAELEFQILESIAGARISGVKDVEYTGSYFTPEVEVVLKGQRLQKDVDYTVSYLSNRNAGTATVRIQGIGRYTGTASAEFQIHKFEWAIDKEATEISTGIKHLQCIACDASKEENTVIAKKKCDHVRTLHIERGATCTTDGNKRYYTCDVYGLYYADADATQKTSLEEVTIPALGHKPVTDNAIAATCTSTGLTKGSHCSVCNEVLAAQIVVPVQPHEYELEYTVDQTAKIGADGSKSYHCRDCDVISEESIVTIPAINAVAFSAGEFVYNGLARKPAAAITDINGEVLEVGSDYKITFKNASGKAVASPKTVGRYTAVVTFTGDYSGSVSSKFVIKPKATVVTKLTKPAKKQIKVTWQKRTVQVTGYEIQYSTTKNFTKATTKSLKVKSYKTNSKTISNLKAKKNYWVRVRTYKTVNGVNFCSAWSAAKQIKTK